MVGLSNLFTSHFGLSHDGRTHSPTSTEPTFGTVLPGPATIDRFVLDTFGSFPTPADYQQFEDLVKFCREFDAGIAPSIGVTYSVDFANKALTATTNVFALLEDQVHKANCGFAIYARIGGTSRGYYFDITGSSDGYHEHGTSTVVTLPALLALVSAGDLLVLQGTPAGSERRIASLTGAPGTLTGAAPANITLEPMRPATQWAPVPLLLGNWDPLAATNPFNWDGGPLLLPTPLSLKSVRLLQRGLLQFAPSGFGLPQLRHEAPRRFAVTGDNIRLGAKLQLRVPAPSTPGTPPPYTNIPGNTTLIEMGLYPTNKFVGEKRVWETTVEADPLLTYSLLLGGPAATGVAAAVDSPYLLMPIEGTTFPAGTFDPVTWNSFHVTVVNEDTTASPGAWLTLTLQ
jgi:hypothetical protein